MRCMVEMKKNYSKKKHRPLGILNVYVMMYWKIKLQLKFRKNNNYSYIIVNFHTRLH
jgi:hypothetical protein